MLYSWLRHGVIKSSKHLENVRCWGAHIWGRAQVGGQGTDQSNHHLKYTYCKHATTHCKQSSLHLLNLSDKKSSRSILTFDSWTEQKVSYWHRSSVSDGILQILLWYQIKWKGRLSWARSNNRPHSLLPRRFNFCTLAHMHGWKHQCLAIAHVLCAHTHTPPSYTHTYSCCQLQYCVYILKHTGRCCPCCLMCARSTSPAEIISVRGAFQLQHKTHIKQGWVHHGGPFGK